MKAQVDGSKEEVFKTLPNGSISDGIAVDYINQLLFYTCKLDQVIVVVSLKNKDIYKTIVNESLDEPKDIIAHPERGVIYWTDSGNEPKIETSTMDGGNRSTIMSFGQYSLPNALALDVKSMNLFWVDAKHGVIGRINIDTGVNENLYSDYTSFLHGLTLVGDKLYITDWSHVIRLSVNGGELEQIGPSTFLELTGITGYKKTDIRTVFSKCLQSTCSHLCLPVSGKDYKCEFSNGEKNALNPCRDANGTSLIDAKNTGQVNLVDVLDELSNETSGTDENSTLLIGDINVAVNTLAEIVDVVTVNTTNLENVTD
ncbi:low-density lipoprotein receptor-related protein 5-like, partial [Ruditapes philippinarum]|uniref:low-density lipoprotein receptor-related protein 5-like n=1 Tax=Ruditapes philippinarum TaxID=129788 RepID=UPI00295B96BC